MIVTEKGRCEMEGEKRTLVLGMILISTFVIFTGTASADLWHGPPGYYANRTFDDINGTFEGIGLNGTPKELVDHHIRTIIPFKDIVEIDVEENGTALISNVECQIDFDGYFGDGSFDVFFLLPKNAENINNRVKVPSEYRSDYNVIAWSIWDDAWQPERSDYYADYSPIDVNVKYTHKLEESNQTYTLKYALIPLDYEELIVLIKLPKNADRITYKPKQLQLAHRDTGTYLRLNENNSDLHVPFGAIEVHFSSNNDSQISVPDKSDYSIYVPDNYSTVQSAVNAAFPGDMIIVRDGTYRENIKVDKRLTIRSENGPDTTIVRAAKNDSHVFEVTANYVNINGFTVEDATWRWTYSDCLDKGNGGSCVRCSIPFKVLVAGIFLDHADYCTISNNKCTNNGRGIYISNSDDNSISDNICSNNLDGDIVLLYSKNNRLAGNSLVGNGINIRGGPICFYAHEIDESNTVNGKTVYYWKEVEGGRVPDGAGQVILVNCTNVTIENQNLSNASVGVNIAFSSFINIRNNTCSNNTCGIHLTNSNDNSIANNICANNRDGIGLWRSDNNSIYKNNCSNNSWYISSIIYSKNNSIYLNNFVNNANASIDRSTNIWNSTEKITYAHNGSIYINYLGNYWDDYTGTDADGDGIGDTPYHVSCYLWIDENSDNHPLMAIVPDSLPIATGDNYPLMEPWENYFV